MVRKTESFYDSLASVLEEVLTEKAGKRVGFCLLVFPFDGDTGGKGADYITNGKREDMIKFLRETATRLENKEDFPRVVGEA